MRRGADGAGWSWTEFVRGFVAMAPLWVGAIPVGVAYGLAARQVGLSAVETIVMSLTVFSAAAQLSAVSLIGDGAPLVVLVATAMALNLQLLLIGLAVGRQTRQPWRLRAVPAYLLTDGAYGVVVARGRLTLSGLAGAGVSMFVAWNAGTGIGAVAGDVVPDLRRLGVDFVAPLMFLVVLVPLLRGRAALVTALVAGVVALALVQLVPAGAVVLGAGLAGCVAGTWLGRSGGAVDREGTTR
jgi:predicted branched-subunit amino acid permease